MRRISIRRASVFSSDMQGRRALFVSLKLAFALLAGEGIGVQHAWGASMPVATCALSPLETWRDIAGPWWIDDASGKRIGELTFSVGSAVGAQGRLHAAGADPLTGGREMFADTRELAPNQLRLNLFRGIGDRTPGLLTLTRDRDEPRTVLNGLLDSGDGWRRVRLVRDGDPQDLAAEASEEEVFDLPGVGFSGPPYRLRNVPPSGSVPVHAGPSRASPVIGALQAGDEDILVDTCKPDVEAYIFEVSDFEGKLALLDAAWCEVIEFPKPCSPIVSGWVEGRHLLPMRERMGEAQIPDDQAGWRVGHNGSDMRLELDPDGLVRIVYERPRDGLAVIGIAAGTLLFDGVVDATGKLVGRARLFSGRCATLEYPVEGRFVAGADLVLTGAAPVRERGGCRVVATRTQGGNAQLLFTQEP